MLYAKKQFNHFSWIYCAKEQHNKQKHDVNTSHYELSLVLLIKRSKTYIDLEFCYVSKNYLCEIFSILIIPIHHFTIATFNCRTLKSDYRVLELIELVRKKCIDVLAIQEHRRTKTALVTDMNIPTGYRLIMNDTHSLGVGGIGFVISPRCFYKLISSEYFSTRIGKLVFDIIRRRIHILSI